MTTITISVLTSSCHLPFNQSFQEEYRRDLTEGNSSPWRKSSSQGASSRKPIAPVLTGQGVPEIDLRLAPKIRKQMTIVPSEQVARAGGCCTGTKRTPSPNGDGSKRPEPGSHRPRPQVRSAGWHREIWVIRCRGQPAPLTLTTSQRSVVNQRQNLG
jgi:hypothetical protein